MASQTDILNLAAQQLSGASTSSLDDNTPEGRAFRLCYDVVRQAELRKFPYNFATRRAALAASATPPAFGYAYQCPLPADFLRLLEVDGETDTQLERDNDGNRVLLTNSAPVNILYTADVTATQTYDPLFVMLFATALALQAARGLTDSNSTIDRLVAAYDRLKDTAGRVDAQENPPLEQPYDSWLEARL